MIIVAGAFAHVNLWAIHLTWIDVFDTHLIDRKKAELRSYCCALWTTDATHGDMARLFSVYGVCARSSRIVFLESSSSTKAGAVRRVNLLFSHKPTALQQRRCIGRSSAAFVRLSSISGIWVCGVGLGVAVAVGLKCRSDAASDLCDRNDRSVHRSERYSDAIKVSRDLVERIKVRAADRVKLAWVRNPGSEVKGRAVGITITMSWLASDKLWFGGHVWSV